MVNTSYRLCLQCLTSEGDKKKNKQLFRDDNDIARGSHRGGVVVEGGLNIGVQNGI